MNENIVLDPSIYDKAISILEERGWHRGGYINPVGEVCILGALALAEGGEVVTRSFGHAETYNNISNEDSIGSSPYTAHLAKTLGYGEDAGHHCSCCGEASDSPLVEFVAENWNDVENRTVEDVKIALKAARDSLGNV